MKLFISYTQADLAWAEWIAWQLEEAGHDVILDRWDFVPGSNFVLRMHEATAEAEKTLAILSPDYVKAAYPQPEWAAAFLRDPGGKERKLVPIRVRPCDLSGLLAAVVYLDLVGMDEPSAAKTLLRVLAENRRKPQEKPLYPGPLKNAPAFPGAPREIPTPRYASEEAQALSSELQIAFRQKEELACAGKNTSLIQKKILDLRRQIREGGQLKAGDFLDDGRFHLIQAVGRGGFATVWKSWDRVSHDFVALKVLHVDLAHDRSRRERFFRGARKMAELQHQGIVRVVKDRIEDGGYCAFAMEYIPGGDLRDSILNGSYSPDEILQILLQVGSALHFAHRKGVIHRDVKPANILMDPDTGPKLTDFDLVQAHDTTGGTRTGMLGTMLYASPEAMARPQAVRESADVYSFGMTAVFAFSGAELPLEVLRNSKAIIKGLRLSAALDAALVQSVEWHIQDRFSTVEEFCNALRKGMDQEKPLNSVSRGQDHPESPKGIRPQASPSNNFESFVVAESNQLAYSAAKAVAENQKRYSPLYICSGPGLGKSHLLHAIASHMKVTKPGLRIKISPAEAFTNDLISSIRSDRMSTFRDEHRELDVLILDDIHFFQNKERSQDELYHTFNALQRFEAQVIVSSSILPKSLVRFDHRVVNYLEGGLLTDINPPELETKLKILYQKCRVEGIDLPEEVALFVAERSGSNIRELLGHLNRLIASANLSNNVITLDFARESLKAVLRRRPSAKPGEIIGVVSKYFELSHAEIKSRSNMKRFALPRQIAMYLCKTLADLSFPEIGGIFGKHHSTVMHSVEKIDQLRFSDEGIARTLKTIEDRLGSL